MSSAPETKVLSQSLENAIGEKRVRTAVFVSFQFDPGFFEHSILPLLFPRGFSENEAVRRAQLDEAMRDLDHLAVYYDRSGLITETGPARLDYRRIGVSTRGGVLHAKHVFLLLEELDDPLEQRLVMLTTSANLTRGGWWENVEVGHVYEIIAGSKDLVREDLLGPGGLFSRLEGLDHTTATGEQRQGRDAVHAGLDELRRFLKTQTQPRKHHQTQGGVLHTRLWHGESTLPEFLHSHVRTGCRLEVLSPFVDDQDDTPTLKALIEQLKPTATRVLLPRDESGRAQCREPFYEAVKALPNVRWGQLPGKYTAFGKGKSETRQRFVHAKVYRIFSPDDRIEMMLVGSPNLTSAAHRGARRGNLESAVLLDLEPTTRPDWWMERLDDTLPIEFRPGAPEDQPPAAVLPVTLRFDWRVGTLSYFWESRPGGNPKSFRVASAGSPVAEVTDPVFEQWKALGADPDHLRSLLRAGSFLDVSADGMPPQRVLVQETGMEDRPSLLRELSPEQILEFWSMLTTEQQDAFLEWEITRLVLPTGEGEDTSSRDPADVTSMFDRFAGIFHAFSCLEERLDESLDRGDVSGERRAIYRLFGKRHDSLGSLINKLLEDTASDRVNRYVSLLCARQVAQWVRDAYPKFASAHVGELEELDARLAKVQELRETFDFGSKDETDRFFAWFEEMFFSPIKLPEARA